VPLSNKQEKDVESRSLIDMLLAQLLNCEEMLRLAKKTQVSREKVILAGGDRDQ